MDLVDPHNPYTGCNLMLLQLAHVGAACAYMESLLTPNYIRVVINLHVINPRF